MSLIRRLVVVAACSALFLSAPAIATPTCPASTWPNYNSSWPNTTATTPAEMALPANWPNDPGFGYLQPGNCNGMSVLRPNQGYWELWSYFPPDTTDPCGGIGFTLGSTLNPAERMNMHGTGMSADLAWTVTTGDPRVLIAVHDSGIEWGNLDLVNKFYLNKGELPLPQHADGSICADYDCNGDGVFNVLDYTSYQPGQCPPASDVPNYSMVVDQRILNFKCPGAANCKPGESFTSGDTNGNGILDPQDLIRVFSDGVDQDGDGFPDDISGWDFFGNTNDPADPEDALGYSHGTGEAQMSSAEGNNGMGSIGVCPDCRVMMVRVGDSFIADSSHFAEGVFFSLSQGANVISEALGSLDNPEVSQNAIDAAYAQGAIVIASAADEDSLHHNYPGNAEHTVLVHTIMYDTVNEFWNATSFVNFANCSNAGEHIALSTPGSACSSEATGLSAGEAGLIYSAMLKYQPNQPPLTSPEAMQLMWTVSEDINVAGSATNATLYPSGPGWDLYFGYGRNDAAAAVTAIKNGQIPPEVDVISPRWFQTFDPSVTPTIQIDGAVAANRAASYDFQVFVGAGTVPQQTGNIHQVASMTGLTTPTIGTLATVNLADIVSPDTGASMNPFEYTATIVVLATAHYGGTIGDVKGQFRKTINIHSDPDLFKGFPIILGSSGESSPHFIDLDGSGHDTLVVGTSDGKVHAISANGTELKGWPVSVQELADMAALPNVPAFSGKSAGANSKQSIAATVAIGSLNGDGKLQVVASTLDGQTYAWNADGSLVSGFPVSADPTHFQPPCGGMDPPGQVINCTDTNGNVESYALGKGFFASPALYDLDGNGSLQIIQPGQDGWLYVWDSNGQNHPGFPVEVFDPKGQVSGTVTTFKHTRLMASPAVGDITGDGKPEIVLGSNEIYSELVKGGPRLYAINHDGNNNAMGAIVTGWPVAPLTPDSDTLPDVGQGEPNPPALADITGDGVLDVGLAPIGGPPQFWNGQGETLGSGDESQLGDYATSMDLLGYAAAVSAGAFADVDGDGNVDFVDGTIGLNFAANGLGNATRIMPDHAVTAWSPKLAYSEQGVGFTASPLPGFPALTADYQFFMNYAVADIDGDGKNEIVSGSGVSIVTAFRSDGSQPTTWPKNTAGWNITTPAFGDLDGDGYLDVASLTRDGVLWIWHGKGKASQKIEWESYHHDAQNTGNYDTKLPTRAGPQPATAKSGCHCGFGGTESALALLGLTMLKRRKRMI